MFVFVFCLLVSCVYSLYALGCLLNSLFSNKTFVGLSIKKEN